MVASYDSFLDRKTQLDTATGFEPVWMPDFLFPFQTAITEWAVEMGRAAIFADCGLGKTPMQLVWAENVRRHTRKPVLIVTPLAVSFQTEAEAQKFGIEAATSRTGEVTAGVTVTNYDRLHHFAPSDFGGVVADESSAIKNFGGVRRALVTDFMRKHRFRLLCTATAAPNDYIELGTSSEALGYLGHMDMLSRFFTNKGSTFFAKGGGRGQQAPFRLKGHAEEPFWRWVASWARACRRPSDLGFADDGFVLPPLEQRHHFVEARKPAEGTLFDLPAIGLREERDEQRRTITERCELAAELSAQHDISIVWCNLNAEGDLLEKLVPNSFQVKGSDSEEYKSAAAEWFTGRLCVCDHPLFLRKLAGWGNGGQWTLSDAERAIEQTLRSENDAGRKDDLQKPTGSTCESTTPSIPSDSSEAPNSRLNITGNAGSDTPLTSTIGSESNNRRKLRQTDVERIGSDSSTASPSPSGTPCSPSKGPDALSAGQTTGSKSTTATKQEPFGDSSVPSATLASASSATTRNVSAVRHCTCGHESGVRRLISKPVMFGLGLNFQHCAHMTYFPSHSYEQMYQAVRRSWRFGQKRPVRVDLITTEGGKKALVNLERKADQASRMFDRLVAHMQDAVAVRRTDIYDRKVEVPAWLS